MPLQKPLPAIAIPLRAGEQDARLDLQPLIEMCYRNGRYSRVDYARPPQPPLVGDDATWAIELLKAGKASST